MQKFISMLTYAAVCFWTVSMIYFWEANSKRINLLRKLDLLDSKKKFDGSLLELVKQKIFELSKQCSPVGTRFTALAKQDIIERRIALAGLSEMLNYDIFLGMRALALMGAMLVGSLLSLIGFGLFTQITIYLLTFFLPGLWLSHSAKKRQEQIGLELPDFLDAMSVSLQAGTPMDPALKYVVSTLDGPLSEEMIRFTQEIDLGVPRETAYNRLMTRNSCTELETLVLSLIQGNRLGVPVANTFKVLAEDIRQTRIGLIKEKAAKAGPKVTLVTSFLILPAVLIAFIGLLVLNFIYNPEGIGISGFTLN